MSTAARADSAAPRSILFRSQAPDSDAARRRRVAAIVTRRVRAGLDAAGCTVTDADDRHVDADLPAAATARAVVERLLADVSGRLHADLIGGVNATRLHRVGERPYLRLRWDEAVALLRAAGRTPAADGRLDSRQADALVRHAGGLPLHLTDLPGGARGAVLLPYGGRACELEAGRMRLDLMAVERYVLGAA